MQIIRSKRQMRRFVARQRRSGRTIGFVPTMGALHEGHLSLIRAARREHRCVIVSIFVNPIQFNDRRDYLAYPRERARDRRIAAAAGASVLFCPDVEALYPPGYATYVTVERLTEPLCGRSRPGHFRGVTTVVAKLLQIVQPETLYLGQKDAQQAVVIRRMVKDLDLSVRVRVLPTVREPDGLAMSSRNVRLTTAQRRSARAIIEALRAARAAVRQGERRPEAVRRLLRRRLTREPSLRVDYAEAVEAATLQRPARLRGRVLIAVAAWVGSVRLIDNVVIRVA